MQPIALGRIRISAVVERAGPTRPTWLLPDAVPEAVERHRAWLSPHFVDDKGRFLQSIHSFVIQAPGLTALVDTCVGNDKDRGGRQPFHMMRTSFLEELGAAGFPPESIDLVLCTHLHVDHVGWNTRLDNGRWVPTFPHARHLFVRREWEHWSSEPATETRQVMADSVTPVLEAGLADLVDMDHRVSDEIWLEPTPGHTPGHVSVRLRSIDREAVITGDLMHHPVQVAEPGWASHFDSDVELGRKTRRSFCERYADGPVTVLGTHFHHPTAGHIVRQDDSWRFIATASYGSVSESLLPCGRAVERRRRARGTGVAGPRPLQLITDRARRWSPAATGQRTRAAWSGDPRPPGPAHRSASPHARQLGFGDGTSADPPRPGGGSLKKLPVKTTELGKTTTRPVGVRASPASS